MYNFLLIVKSIPGCKHLSYILVFQNGSDFVNVIKKAGKVLGDYNQKPKISEHEKKKTKKQLLLDKTIQMTTINNELMCLGDHFHHDSVKIPETTLDPQLISMRKPSLQKSFQRTR